jgi:phosphopantothenoylcysteine decarboxylase
MRAWNHDNPVIVCPAMNTQMWLHPVTAQHIQTLQQWGVQIVMPISKQLMCGDTGALLFERLISTQGIGAMAEVDTIVECVCAHRVTMDKNDL